MAGLVTVWALCVLLSVVYLWRGSLVASIVMHCWQDFVGMVLGR